MIENRHVSRVLQSARVIFPPFSLTHNFWRQIWTMRRLVVCTRTSLQLGAYWSSKNQNHLVKLLLNKLKATNRRKVTKCFQNCCRLMTDFARKTRHMRQWQFSRKTSLEHLLLQHVFFDSRDYWHCTSSGRLSSVLEYIKCIKRTCKVGDFKVETSEEQPLDWLDNSVWCWVLGAKMGRSFCWSSAAVIELKRKGLIFPSSKALFTRYKLTRVRPGLKLTRVSFCRVNTANPGSTRVSLKKCRVNTTWVSLCRVNRA